MRIALLRILPATVYFLIVLGLHAAAAQSAFSQQAAQLPASYCKTSTLTGAKFIRLIHTIVAHGDLTDVSFIATTLGNKFSFDQDWSWDLTAAPNVLHLKSDKVLGSVITATLSILKTKSQQLKTGYVAAMNMDGPPNFMSNCLHIPISHFSSDFGGNFFFRPIGQGVPSGMATQLRVDSGKNSSRIIVSFSFEFKNNFVDGVSITQRP